MIAVEVYRLIHVALQNCVNNYRPKYILYKHSVYASLLCALSEFWETWDTDRAFYTVYILHSFCPNCGMFFESLWTTGCCGGAVYQLLDEWLWTLLRSSVWCCFPWHRDKQLMQNSLDGIGRELKVSWMIARKSRGLWGPGIHPKVLKIVFSYLH